MLSCGFDSGDCGTEDYGELFGILLGNTPKNYTIPLGLTAVYFNLSDVFGNDTITAATHTKSSVVRTAVLSQKHRVLTLTLSQNASLETVEFFLQASNATGNKVQVCEEEGEGEGRLAFLHFVVEEADMYANLCVHG